MSTGHKGNAGTPSRRRVADLRHRRAAVFSKFEIVDRLDRKISDPEGLVITPLLDREDDMELDSVDLRLGSHFLLPRSLPQPYFAPDKRTATSLHTRVHVPLGRYLVVPAHQTVLGATLEFIKLPCNASGEILTKSSVARTFVLVETAPWVHPGYRGCLTLEIANVSNTPVLLYPGRRIGQLILLHVDLEHDPNARVKSTYFGPVYPEAPTFNNPEEDLQMLGVRSTSVIRKGTIAEREFTPEPD